MPHAKTILAAGLALCATQANAAEPSMDWLAGQWCGGEDGRSIEEVWLPEAGGSLIGLSRTLRNGALESFEFMRIVRAGEQRGLHVQPNGAPPTLFAIAQTGEGWVRLENPENDFPHVIEYRRDGDNLRAYIAGPGPDGKEMKIPFDYRRCGV
mgnify:CR=1 FL=1